MQFLTQHGFLSLIALAAFAPRANAQLETLVPTGATWRYLRGTTEASSPDITAWRTLGFIDTTWQSGAAVFYYGESFTGTVISDMQDRFSTLYLRRKFTVEDASQVASLSMTAICDDGFVAWINGKRVASLYPPVEAEPLFSSFASGNIPEPVQFTLYTLPDPAGYLVSGDNVLAVQVFNANLGSSDIVFDTELTAIPRETVPPTITAIAPQAGTVTNLTSISVTFSEAVQGVDAVDLWVNGVPATTVSGSGASYTFGFAQPNFGPVTVSWDMNCGIADLTTPPNPFNPTAPGSTWNYQFIDPSQLSVRSVHPPPNVILSSLTQVEVTFSRPVEGVDAADLRLNQIPASSVLALSSSVYRFDFDPALAGVASFTWATDNGIRDLTPQQNPLAPLNWQYTVDPAAPQPDLVLNEFVAENVSGYLDEDGDTSGWIELRNRGASAVNLSGWSLTDDATQPNKWVFPAVTLGSGQYLVVFASGKDRRSTAANARLHTNFKLRLRGEYLGLYNAELPAQVVDELAPEFPEQRNDYSYGRIADGSWRYFKTPTPKGLNGLTSITNSLPRVHFSVERGFFAAPFALSLACENPDATIRYTIDGSVPTETNGVAYTAPIQINTMRVVRAAAFKTNSLPSLPVTHSYLYGQAANRRFLPALSIVTATNNLRGRTGIMEVNPRNTIYRGIAWERPISMEWIRPEDNGGFQVDCGLRVHGGDYIRGQYNPSGGIPYNKYSFNVFFRGDYGAGKLDYPLFGDIPVKVFDTVVLRAGMNDPTNPFIRDELARQLAADTGQAASHGTFCNLFINGVYKGYYNPTERINEDFLQAWHGGGFNWDQIAQFGDIAEGDGVKWNQLLTYATNNLALAANYQGMCQRLDVTNFVDYLLPLIHGDCDDWPHNNWRAAREMTSTGIFRFYVWDAEWSYGYNNPASHNTIANQLSSLSPPWGGTEIQRLYRSLRASPEFKLLFADRVHKHFFNDGALTDERIRARYEKIKAVVRSTIAGFNDTIGTAWIPQRRRYLTNHMAQAGLIASSNAPFFVQFGGRVPENFALTMTTLATNGTVYYTLDGTDPRVPFTSAVAPGARMYDSNAPPAIATDLTVCARTLVDTNWSALAKADFQVARLGLPLRITEIMYNPVGGDAYEFIEIQNVGGTVVDLNGVTLEGVQFQFTTGATINPGARLILASSLNPTAFAQRYGNLAVAGWFDNSLSNGGERLALIDRNGQTITSVSYDDESGWPTAADGGGSSLELVNLDGDPDSPVNWQASRQSGGTPGAANSTPLPAPVRLNEVFAVNAGRITSPYGTHPGYIELFNPGATTVSLKNWSLSNGGDPRKYVFPNSASLATQQYLVIWCDSETNKPGLHSGFVLDGNGDQVYLHDNKTNRVDAVAFGNQVADQSLGRLDPDQTWHLCDPTQNALNEAAQLGAASDLAINELMANPPVGSEDWFELFNRDPLRPVALQGLYLSTSNALFRIGAQSFAPPGGFVVLQADEKPGANHVDFKLPASGGVIKLADAAGTAIVQLTYPAQAAGVSQGLLPDGTGPLTSFPRTASPGAPNYITNSASVVLNEFMAWNTGSVTRGDGVVADWIELFNPTGNAIDLTGMSLSIDDNEPGQWTFPVGASLASGRHVVFWCDGPASTNWTQPLHIDHPLPREGGAIYLFNADGQIVDSVEFGFQLRDRTIGRVPEGWALLNAPSLGNANAGAHPLGVVTSLRLNEWMAQPRSGDEWFELYNLDPLPVNLAGCVLTDDPSIAGRTNTVVGPLSFIAANGWVKFLADGNRRRGPNHAGFQLDAWGETLRLYDALGQIVDTVDYGVETEAVSEGRLPDGAAAILTFEGTASPEEANYHGHPAIVVSEVLTHTDPPLEDVVEFQNLSDAEVDISGWYLSNTRADLRKYRVPDRTVISARAFRVIYEKAFNPTPATAASFTFNSAHGDEAILSEVDGSGNFTGYRASVKFGAAINGISFGRHATSWGVDFTAQSRRTLGADTPSSPEQFRLGRGLPNAYPAVGPVVINEIMYHPVRTEGTNLVEDVTEEFIELRNLNGFATPLFDESFTTNTWRLDGGVQLTFPMGTWIPARGRLLVVNFDPATNTVALSNFVARFNVDDRTQLVGPYAGKLNNDRDRVELYMPDTPQAPPHPDAGFVPQVLVDLVDYRDQWPWPVEADGTSASLQRRRAADYGNDPLNWFAGAPSAGRDNSAPAAVDTDGDGMADDWEILFGFLPGYPTDGAMDSDGDGLSNAQEFAVGTNPRDAGSHLNVQLVTPPDGSPTIRFDAVADCSYTVWYRDDLEGAIWQRLGDVNADPRTRTVELPAVLPVSGDRFFLLQSPKQP